MNAGPLLGWMQQVWETLPVAVGVTSGPRHLLVYQNAASCELFGRRPWGVSLGEAFPESDPQRLADLDQVFSTGVPVTRGRQPVGIRDYHGREVQMKYVVAPYGPEGGPPQGLVITAVDLSGEARAELAANRARLAARVTARIHAAPDADAALQSLTDSLVPELADVAAVYVWPDTPHAARLRAAASRAQAVTLSAEAQAWSPLPDSAQEWPAPWDEVFAAGRPVIFPMGKIASAVGANEARSAWLAAIGARNIAAVPLTVAGRLLGSLVLIAAGDRQPYSELILPFLTDIAARAGLAIAQGRQHRLQAEVSLRLQEALLPDQPPSIPGLQVAARYQAGAEGVHVGGDWWDVVQLDGSRVAIGVGDAAGRGVNAAILMGQARAAMRTAALAGFTPAQVLALVDKQLAEQIHGSSRRPPEPRAGRGDLASVSAGLGMGQRAQFATALHAVLDLAEGQVVLANAGHPPPLLRRPGSPSRKLAIPPGPPLGTGVGGYTETVIDFSPGDSLLFFTDGLIEDRHRDVDTGMAQLAAALDAHLGPDIHACLRAILQLMTSGRPPARSSSDDIALVLVQLDPEHAPAPATPALA